jgi:hypothetical protein
MQPGTYVDLKIFSELLKSCFIIWPNLLSSCYLISWHLDLSCVQSNFSVVRESRFNIFKSLLSTFNTRFQVNYSCRLSISSIIFWLCLCPSICNVVFYSLSLLHNMFQPNAAVLRCSSLDGTCWTAMPFFIHFRFLGTWLCFIYASPISYVFLYVSYSCAVLWPSWLC